MERVKLCVSSEVGHNTMAQRVKLKLKVEGDIYLLFGQLIFNQHNRRLNSTLSINTHSHLGSLIQDVAVELSHEFLYPVVPRFERSGKRVSAESLDVV